MFKKSICLLLIGVLLLSIVFTSSAADSYLSYGYDEPLDSQLYSDYQIYGNNIFLELNPNDITNPSGVLYIFLSDIASMNIIRETNDPGKEIITEDYFPELEIESIKCDGPYTDSWRDSILNDHLYNYQLFITVVLKDKSIEGVKNALVALGPRAVKDVEIAHAAEKGLFIPPAPDIYDPEMNSYKLSDVNVILKYIAGWKDITLYEKLDATKDGEITTEDATLILKKIAGWDV